MHGMVVIVLLAGRSGIKAIAGANVSGAV